MRFLPAVLIASLLSVASANDEPIFSGPQTGEKLNALNVIGVYGKYAGREMELIAEAGDRLVLLVIVNGANRPAASLTRALMNWAELQSAEKLYPAIVWLTDDISEAPAYLKRAIAWWGCHSPVGISVDGPEGPGSYGLNSNVNVTVLVGKNGRVIANFALVQPSLTDVPKIMKSFVDQIGGQVPTEQQIGFLSMPTRHINPDAPSIGPRDIGLRKLLIQLLADHEDPRDLEPIREAIEKYVTDDANLRQELGQSASILHGFRAGTPPVKRLVNVWIDRYGSPEARERARNMKQKMKESR